MNPELRWSYSQAGLLKSDTSQGNRVITHSPDRFGRDTLQVDVTGTWRFRYDAVRGALDTLITPFGDTLHWTFDARSRAIGPYVANGTSPDYSVVPAWDTGGTLVDMTTTHVVTTGHWNLPQQSDIAELNLVPAWYETHGSGGANVVAADLLTHDGWGRVTAAAYVKSGVVIATDSMAFTVDGNVLDLQETRSHNPVTTRLLTRSGGGGPARTYTYDRSGNLATLSDGAATWAYSYDALERLTSVRRNDSLVSRYGYDATGRRIVKRGYAATGAPSYLRMIYSGDQVRGETDSVGTTLSLAYTWGPGLDNLIAVHRYANPSDWYAVLDPLGSVRGFTRRDGTWEVSWRYRIYGNPVDSAGTPPFEARYRWTGREYDRETGFYYFRSRYFDPGAARFTQEDPIGFAGGANLYAYGDGDPTDGKDADGLAADYGTMIFQKLQKNNRPSTWDEWFTLPDGSGGEVQVCWCWGPTVVSSYVDGVLGMAAVIQLNQGYDSYRQAATDRIRAAETDAEPMTEAQWSRSIRALMQRRIDPSAALTALEMINAGSFVIDRLGQATGNRPNGEYVPGVTWRSNGLLMSYFHPSIFANASLGLLANVLIHESLHQLAEMVGDNGPENHCRIYRDANRLSRYRVAPPPRLSCGAT